MAKSKVEGVFQIVEGAALSEPELRELMARIQAKLSADDNAISIAPSALEAFEQRLMAKVAAAIAGLYQPHSEPDETTMRDENPNPVADDSDVTSTVSAPRKSGRK